MSPRHLALIAALFAAAACSGPAPGAAKASPAAGAPSAAVAPLPAPLEVGSQAARDAYYCAGLLGAAFPMPEQALSPNDMATIFRGQNLSIVLRMDGFGKLMDEKAALAPQTGAVADAWADLAAKDYGAKTPRIPLKTCEDMAGKLPAN